MIHITADVQTDKIGIGTYVWQYSIILKGAKIGNNCNINCHCFVENDVNIGDIVTVKSGVYLWDGIDIESDVFIGPNVTFVNDIYPRSKKYPEKFLGSILKEGASVGANSTILAIKHGNFGKINISGVKIFTCNFPVKLTQYLGFLWGIWKCNVAYLPRGNSFKYQKFLLKLFKKKSFKTIERIIDKDNPEFIYKDYNTLINNFSFTDRLYSITNFMRDYHITHHDLYSEKEVLPLATDTIHFDRTLVKSSKLKEVIFIGNDMKRKGIGDYLKIASHFPSLIFNVVGRDDLGFFSKNKSNPANIVYHGMLDHSQMKSVLLKCDLYILPSRSEGFPRGIIETAAAGVATITYGEYGASEWIENFVNGYVGDNIDDLMKAVHLYMDDSNLLTENKINAQKLAQKYSANKVVLKYEQIIEDLYYS